MTISPLRRVSLGGPRSHGTDPTAFPALRVWQARAPRLSFALRVSIKFMSASSLVASIHSQTDANLSLATPQPSIPLTHSTTSLCSATTLLERLTFYDLLSLVALHCDTCTTTIPRHLLLHATYHLSTPTTPDIRSCRQSPTSTLHRNRRRSSSET